MSRHIATLRRTTLTALVAGLLALGPAAVAPATAASNSFTAHYYGYFTYLGCFPTCTIHLTGVGPASILGTSVESTVMSATALSIPCVQVTGATTLTVATGDKVLANLAGSLCIQIPPIKGLSFSVKYTVTGGTGAYTGASGSGTNNGVLTFHRTYRDAWKGTLTP